MKAVRVANLQAVAFSELITIVRGDTAFSIRKSELADLVAVLRELGADDTSTASAQPTVEELNVEPVEVSPMLSALMPVRSPAITTGKRRRGVWSEIRSFLRSCQRAQGHTSIVRHIRRAQIVDGDVDTTISRVLDSRLKSGDLIVTKSGRYRLAGG